MDQGRSDYSRIELAHVPATSSDLLVAMGVTVRPPTGQVMYWVDRSWRWWRELGAVVVGGDGIELLPHVGLSEADLDVLRGAGCEAFCTPPATADHWDVRSDGRWECTISVPAD